MRLSTTPGRLFSQPALLAALALAFSFSAQAATINVDSGTDDGAGCTLREAAISANSDTAFGGCTAGDAGDDTITFSVGTVTLTAGMVNLTDDVTVDGPVTINAAPDSRIFSVQGTPEVTFNDVTFQNGVGDGGAIGFELGSSATVTVTGGAFNSNRAPSSGGAIWVSAGGSLTVDGATFTGNRARGGAATQGGGAIFTAGGSVTVTDATFTDNRAIGASGSGGAIASPNGATLSVATSTFTQNRSQRAGGAVEVVGGTAALTGNTFTSNSAGANPGNGGAVHAAGDAAVTVTGGRAEANRAVEGGAFWVGSGSTLTVDGTDVEGNLAEGIDPDQGGGGVYVDGGTLVVTGATFTDNRAIGASGSGGALLVNGGSATVTGATTFTANRSNRAGGAIEVAGGASVTVEGGAVIEGNLTGAAPGNGGGLHVTGAATVTVDSSTVRSNRAEASGGGLWNSGEGSLTVTRTTVTLNWSPLGGGIYQDIGPLGTLVVDESLVSYNEGGDAGGGIAIGPGATVEVLNSTIYGNTARGGAGVASTEARVTFDSATIAANVARTAGGGLLNPDANNRPVSLRNTIVADNEAPNNADLAGRYTSNGFNVIGTTPTSAAFPAQPSDQTGTDPMLEPLADNGGPTETAALAAGSPAIDAGSTDLAVDQRGVARTEPDDVGAVEFGDATSGGDPAMALVITGTVDGPLTGGVPKAIEFYVVEDIEDLSAYGVESANNGAPPVGPEFTFPAEPASAGDFLYLASETDGFTTFFGFAPDYTSGVANNNGDDVLLLYYTGGDATAVVDTFGEPGVDGSGEPWEYTDGWAYREDGTGPDGDTFVIGNWIFSGIDALDGETSNDTAGTPFPIGTYSPEVANERVAAPVAALAAAMDEPVRLEAVVPNPFGTRASTTFTVRESQAVTVSLYDVMGRRVQELYAGTAEASAPVAVLVDGARLAAGVYVLVLQGETVRTTRQVTVVR